MPALISAIRDHDCDRIIHLAAFLGEEVQRRPYSGVRLNFMGTVNVFEAARLEKVARVIFPSSGTVYLGSLGEGLAKIDESIADESALGLCGDQSELRIHGARLCKALWLRVYLSALHRRALRTFAGSLKATREIAIQQMIRAAVKGETAKIDWPYGPAEILYGKDAAKGTVLAVLKDKFKDTLFHIGNGIMLSGDDIVAAVRKAYPGSNIELIKGNNPMPYPGLAPGQRFFPRQRATRL